MRIIIQFYYDFLRKKTAAIDIEDEEADCSVLLKAISSKVDRPLEEIVAIVKKDNIPVRIIQGWPIYFYEIREKTQINVEFKDQENDDSKKKSSALNNRYLMKLGINKQAGKQKLTIIRDFEEEENDDENEGGGGGSGSPKSGDSVSKKAAASRKKSSKNSQIYASSSSDEESNGKSKTFDLKKMLVNFLESLIRETKNNNLDEVKRLLVESPDRLTADKKEELAIKKINAINELGSDGFSPLHHAVSLKFTNIVKEFIEKGANVNIPNLQGWTSVQTAIHKNDIKTLRLLLESPTVDLNYISQVGTAITVACQFQRAQALALLLEKNPNIKLTDSSGRTGLDLCMNDECRQMLKQYEARINGEAEKAEQRLNQQQQQQRIHPLTIQAAPAPPGEFLPPKPPIVRGTVFKIGALLFNLRERYFVINPDEGTLIRYKHISHFPLRPLEVIPLKDITHIQIVTKSWFMSSDYTYFEINYPNRQVLACKHESTAKKWVQYLFSASVYSYYMESRKSLFNVNGITTNTTIDLIDSKSQKSISGNPGGSILEAVNRIEYQSGNSHAAVPSQYDQQQQIKQRPANVNTTKQLGNSGTSANVSKGNSSPCPSPAAAEEKDKRNKEDISKRNGRDVQQQNLSSQKTSASSPKERSPDSSSSDMKGESNNNGLEPQNVDLGGLEDEKVTFESFQILKVLGAGSFGKVFLAKKKDTGNVYAIKALKKRPLILKRQLKYAVTEANVLKMCNHPFVLGLHFALQTPNYLYLVLDYCNGGDISSHLAYKGTFTEEEAIFYIAELILAINHIHEKDVVYRDLKPENILIAADGHIKLADFGLSKDNVSDSAKTTSFCGTPAYLSPEMLNKKGASKASDLYGIGAVLYEMLTGDPPYYNDDIPAMYKKIKEGNLTFPSHVSQKARNIINGLLDRNPKTRLGANDREQLKRDPFFESINWEKLYNKEYQPPITEFNDSDVEDDFEDISDKKIFTDFDYEAHNQTTNRVKQFSFVRK